MAGWGHHKKLKEQCLARRGKAWLGEARQGEEQGTRLGTAGQGKAWNMVPALPNKASGLSPSAARESTDGGTYKKDRCGAAVPPPLAGHLPRADRG